MPACASKAVAQAAARELGPKNIHVAHLIIDSGVDTEWVRQRRIEALGPNALDNPDLLMPPSSVVCVRTTASPAIRSGFDRWMRARI